jgi:hypothetical protein
VDGAEQSRPGTATVSKMFHELLRRKEFLKD